MTPTPQEKWNKGVRNLRDKECADVLQGGLTTSYTSQPDMYENIMKTKIMTQLKPKKVYISKVRNMLITTKELKNGIVYGDEISLIGTESVQWKQGEERHCIGTAIPVYAVVDKDSEVLTEQLPFYFDKEFAVSAMKQMNRHISHKEKKPYKFKKAYLFYPSILE